MEKQTVLTIAGFDPSSGAGITADLMVFAAHGLFGTSCITALTVQSTIGVAATQACAADFIGATLNHLHADLPPAGVKIGMLGTAEIVSAVAAFLRASSQVPIVLDPVLCSSSGRSLLTGAGLNAMREELLPLVSVLTPNLSELEVLAGTPVTSREQMVSAAYRMRERYPGLALVVTGGHLAQPDDLLIAVDGRRRWMRGERIETACTHGTGCAFSSALLSRLVLGDEMADAASAAKSYVAQAMRLALPRGAGASPVEHLWPLHPSGTAVEKISEPFVKK